MFRFPGSGSGSRFLVSVQDKGHRLHVVLLKNMKKSRVYMLHHRLQ